MLNGDRRLDGRVRVVARERKVLVSKAMDILDRRVECHRRERTWGAGELLAGLIEVIRVKMQVAEGVDEIARLQAGDLGDHHREQGVAGDVKGHAEKEIGTALVELAA